MLVEISHGKYVNTDEIAEVHAAHSKDERTTVVLKSGKTQLSDYPADDLVKMMSTVIAATPGYFTLEYVEGFDEEEKEPYVKEEIIGWLISELSPHPITPHNNITFSIHYGFVILAPSGKVIRPECTTWDSIDKWVASMREEEARKKANKAAKDAA